MVAALVLLPALEAMPNPEHISNNNGERQGEETRNQNVEEGNFRSWSNFEKGGGCKIF
jgi:hypothetical protein